MGECADDLLNGLCCEVCGCFFMDNEEPGYPRLCNGCGGKDGETFSIWNKDGDRLFYSDKEADVKTAKDLLTIQKAWTDAQLAEIHMGGKPQPVFEQRMSGYFNAYWKKKVVQLCKRATGYDW